jgi:flavin reductase (DIM6/NTAB) family NADH-FMN oxidoreductase RutF
MGDATGTWLFAFSSAAQKSTHEVKGTLTNIRHTGEFVVNVVSHEMAEAMNRTSGE